MVRRSDLDRHIDVKYHFGCHLVMAKLAKLRYLQTELMTADIFTKPPGPNRCSSFAITSWVVRRRAKTPSRIEFEFGKFKLESFEVAPWNEVDSVSFKSLP